MKTQLLFYLLFQARHAEKIGVDAIACFAPGFYKAESEGKICNCSRNLIKIEKMVVCSPTNPLTIVVQAQVGSN